VLVATVQIYTLSLHDALPILGSDVEIRREEVVGPRVSTELLAKSTIGLAVAIVAILIYLWFRFEWQFALGAMVANVHDLVLTIGDRKSTRLNSSHRTISYAVF